MKFGHVLVGAILAFAPLNSAVAADYLNGEAPPVQQPETLHIGPSSTYEVLATIRPGTAPKLKFCQYHGRWCYGSYGRWNGWYYGGQNLSDHWTLGYLFGQ